MSISIAVGLLTAAAFYLMMQRGMIRIVLGFVLISHAANLLIFSTGNTAFRAIPYIGHSDPTQQADPLPQAFVLTAIVIAFSITMFMITLAITTTSSDDTENEEVTAVKVIRSALDPQARSEAEAAVRQEAEADTETVIPATGQLPQVEEIDGDEDVSAGESAEVRSESGDRADEQKGERR